MQMNCLIVDDNAIARSTLRQLLKVERSLNLIAECENADEAYQYLANQHIDLLLLDVEMPGISGLDLVKGLGKYKPLVILISSERNYAADGFELNVVDFITKPVMPDRFLKSVIKAKEIFESKNLYIAPKKDGFVFIKDGGIIRRLKLDDVLYLEAQGDYVKIFIQGKNFSIYSTLKAVEDKLPIETFVRVHRSFIVNVEKIDTIEGNTLIMAKNFIPVSEAYKVALAKRMHIL